MAEIEEKALANIVRAEIVTEEDVPKTYRFDTADEADVKAKIDKGRDKILRVKNRILARNRTEDIVTGYEINFKNNTLSPELLALIDGGTLEMDSETPTKIVGYDAPASGQVVNRTPFTLNVYTEEKDTDGSTVEYARFIFKHCKGKPVDFKFKDGDFFVPDMKAESAPKKDESPIEIDFLNTLPA